MSYKNIDSKILLARCYSFISERQYKIINVDSSVCLEKPKIKTYAGQMKTVIAGILDISIDDISIKATTNEKMGFIGREEGLVAYATVLLQKV
jgi:2-C-methyl-D-erythritol 2,4-cyclodiphosphate synthase